MFDFIGSIGIAIPMIVLMSWVVSVASDKLGDVLHVLGIKLKIPSTVRSYPPDWRSYPASAVFSNNFTCFNIKIISYNYSWFNFPITSYCNLSNYFIVSF